MSVPSPHFLLFPEARLRGGATGATEVGQWRFVLESVDGESRFEASDEESESDSERLELLALVRGLEALDQPSTVTLVTRNRGLSRDLRFGLAHWRGNDWGWKKFGQRIPVKDADLWRRVDHALRFHELQCRILRLDAPDAVAAEHEEPVRGNQGEAKRSRTATLGRRALGRAVRLPFRVAWRMVRGPFQVLGNRRAPTQCAA
jgi:ribonuclease HI